MKYYINNFFRLGIVKRLQIAIIAAVIIFTSVSNAQNWEQVSLIDSTEVFSLTEHLGELFAVTADDIFIGKNKSANWQKTAGKPQTSSKYFTIYSYKENLYLGTFDDGVFRSTDSGENWEKLNNGLPSSALGIVEFAGRGDSLFVGTDNAGIYVLNLLNPVTWKSYNTGLSRFGTNSIFSVGDNIFAEIGMTFYMRNKKVSEWESIFIDSVEIQRHIFDYITQDEFLFAGTNNGIYRSSLDAKNWERKDITQFEGRDISAFAVHGTRLYAGLLFSGQHWIFSTEDYGETWDFKAHEFSWLYDMLVFENRLWCARLDGLWFLELNEPNDVEEPKSSVPNKLTLEQNYPNPFNPSTTIKFTTPPHYQGEGAREGFVSLIVYDILGQKIRTLLNQNLNPGNYEIEFDGTGLPSGVYFYTLESGNLFETKKMILMR